MSDMSKKLSGVLSNLRSGLGKMNEEAKSQAEGKAPSSAAQEDQGAVESRQEEVAKARNPDAGAERLTAIDDDDFDDSLIIDAEPLPEKPKAKSFFSQMTTKQKALMLAAIGIAAFAGQKMLNISPVLPHVATTATPANSADSELAAPPFDIGQTDAKAPDTPPSSFGQNTEPGKDPANAPIISDQQTADLDKQLAGLNEDSGEMLDPFSGALLPDQSKTEVKPPKSAGEQSSSKTSLQPNGENASAHEPAAELGLLNIASDSPFGGSDSKSTELSGTKKQNADSKGGELLDQSATVDVVNLKAKVAENERRIGELQTEIDKVKKDLAARGSIAVANASTSKSKSQKAPQHKPAPSAHSTTQRSTPMQRVASAPRAPARPKICVTAVAQAARNCSTCVAHAFITHRGVETMVGQGDYIEGLRVNIIGDQLDLQNAQGEVVHKFWSSHNGCAG